jgi:hypothetical protein
MLRLLLSLLLGQEHRIFTQEHALLQARMFVSMMILPLLAS